LAQILVQAIAFVSGIIVIRFLTKDEYAYYTIANTMLGTMTVLSDGGISMGVLAQGGKVWQDRIVLGKILASGFALRKKMAVVSLLILLPILFYLLLHQGASNTVALLIITSLIPAFWAALSDSLLQTPLKLHQAIRPLQKNQVEVGIGRLILTGITVFAFPWAFAAILASGIPRVLGNIRLKNITKRHADLSQLPDPVVKQNLLKSVKRILPNDIYNSISGQIAIWVIAIFGATSSVAEIGALSRVSALLIIFTTMAGVLIIPRYARLPNNKKILLKQFNKVIIGVPLLLLAVIALIYIFSPFILQLLGNDYAGLDYELVLVMIGGCISTSRGIFTSLCWARGWIINPVISILSSIIPFVLGCIVLDISILINVLYINIFIATLPLLVYLLYGYTKIRQVSE